MIQSAYVTIQIFAIIFLIFSFVATMTQQKYTFLSWVITSLLFAVAGIGAFGIEVLTSNGTTTFSQDGIAWLNILFSLLSGIMFFNDLFAHLGIKVFGKKDPYEW